MVLAVACHWQGKLEGVGGFSRWPLLRAWHSPGPFVQVWICSLARHSFRPGAERSSMIYLCGFSVVAVDSSFTPQGICGSRHEQSRQKFRIAWILLLRPIVAPLQLHLLFWRPSSWSKSIVNI